MGSRTRVAVLPAHAGQNSGNRPAEDGLSSSPDERSRVRPGACFQTCGGPMAPPHARLTSSLLSDAGSGRRLRGLRDRTARRRSSAPVRNCCLSSGRDAVATRLRSALTCDAPAPVGVTTPTMRKRRRTRGASEPFGPLTQVARPWVAAKSPAPMVESATISIEEITTDGATDRSASAPRSPALQARRRSHPPCSSRPKPSGRQLRTHRREPSQHPESRPRRTKKASLGGYYVRTRCKACTVSGGQDCRLRQRSGMILL